LTLYLNRRRRGKWLTQTEDLIQTLPISQPFFPSRGISLQSPFLQHLKHLLFRERSHLFPVKNYIEMLN